MGVSFRHDCRHAKPLFFRFFPFVIRQCWLFAVCHFGSEVYGTDVVRQSLNVSVPEGTAEKCAFACCRLSMVATEAGIC